MKRKKNEKRFSKKKRRSYGVLLMLLFCIWLLPVRCLADEPERITYQGAIFIESEGGTYPQEILEQDGKQYRRVSVETRPAEKKGTLTYVSTTIPLQLEGKQEPPEEATITLVCEFTGKEYQREVSLQETREKKVFWVDDFSFPLTVHGYHADAFYLGEYEIPAGTDLAEYGNMFLEYLKLPQDCYRIERVEWSGESYEQEGILCRDAVAYGEKLVREVEVLYGGQVRTLNIPAKQYVAIYEEITESKVLEESVPMETEELLEITETEEEPEPIEQTEKISFVEQVLRWIREHITVVVFSSLFLVAMFSWLLLLWLSGKKKKGKAED